MRSKLDAPKAITAMAHRLARLVYRMLKYGQHYVDKGAEYYEQRNRLQQIEFLTRKAAHLGLERHTSPSLKLSIQKFLESRNRKLEILYGRFRRLSSTEP